MSQPLLPRRKFRKNSRGISSLIAAIFMVIIILFMSFNVFTFTLFKNTQFRDAVDALNQMDVEQTYERISFSGVSFTPWGDPTPNKVLVEAQLKNDGPVSVKVVTLWVVHTATEKYNHTDKLNIDLGVGATYPFQRSVTIEGLGSSGEFTAWFVTARGNRIPFEAQVIYAELSQGMGSIVMDFDNFRYFFYQVTNTTFLNYPEGIISFDVPKQAYVGFGIYLENQDPKKRTITIDGHSLFWQPGRPGGASDAGWFIVNVNDDGTLKSTNWESFSEITLEYGEKEMLIFASENDLAIEGKSFSALRIPNAVTTVATFLVLHGQIGSVSFAQNIPFVSLFYS